VYNKLLCALSQIKRGLTSSELGEALFHELIQKVEWTGIIQYLYMKLWKFSSLVCLCYKIFF